MADLPAVDQPEPEDQSAPEDSGTPEDDRSSPPVDVPLVRDVAPLDRASPDVSDAATFVDRVVVDVARDTVDASDVFDARVDATRPDVAQDLGAPRDAIVTTDVPARADVTTPPCTDRECTAVTTCCRATPHCVGAPGAAAMRCTADCGGMRSRCVINADCCAGMTCQRGACFPVGATCAGLTCGQDNPCCATSPFCGGAGATGAFGCRATCSPEGDRCARNSDCCGGLGCNSRGVCVTHSLTCLNTYCYANYGDSRTGGTTIAQACCPSAPYCAGTSTNQGAAGGVCSRTCSRGTCFSARDCCGGALCLGGFCTTSTEVCRGDPCTSRADCCPSSPNCTRGASATTFGCNNNCSATGRGCTASADCCSNRCSGGTCL